MDDSSQVTDVSFADIAAVETNLIDHSFALADARLGRIQRGGAVQWVRTGRNTLNRVVCARIDPGEEELRISEIMRRFATWQEGLIWIVGPTTRPPDLGHHLKDAGFADAGQWSGMAASLIGRPREAVDTNFGNESLQIRELTDVAEIRTWSSIGTATAPPEMVASFHAAFADGFRRFGYGKRVGLNPRDPEANTLPTWRFFVGYWLGQPAARCLTFSGSDSEIVGLHWVWTEEEFRRRGCASALIRTALRAARHSGHRMAVVHAPSSTQPQFQRLGFTRICTFDTFRWKPAAR